MTFYFIPKGIISKPKSCGGCSYHSVQIHTKYVHSHMVEFHLMYKFSSQECSAGWEWKTTFIPLTCFLFKPSLPTLHLLGRLQPCAVTRPSSFCMWALTCLYWALFCSLRDGELHWSFLQQYIFQYYLRLQSYIPAKWTSNTDGLHYNVEFILNK